MNKQSFWIYFVRRILLMIPTLFIIMLVNFLILHAVPNGPAEQIAAKTRGFDVLTRITGSNDNVQQENLKGDVDLEEQVLQELRVKFGLDKPLHVQFFTMIGRYLTFDFGYSYIFDKPVIDLIWEKMPVSLSLGVWSTAIIYMIAVPLGIAQAVRRGTPFDASVTILLTIAYSIPAFLLAILLITFFAGGRYFSWFPLEGLTSENASSMSLPRQILDYLWHIALPVFTITIGGFSSLSLLTRNCFLEELRKQYVITALAKGVMFKKVLIRHIFRNAMLLIIAGFPSILISMLFTSSLLVELIFNLDGLGLLGFEATLSRDYAVMFATLFAFTLLGLLLGIISDIIYTLVDPRIDFASSQK